MQLKKLLIIAILILMFNTTACKSNSVLTTELPGNSTGNIANGGIAAMFEEQVFFCNAEDDNRIYRGTSESKDIFKVSDNRAEFINIFGDWLIYINLDKRSTIYRTKIDGSKTEQINDNRSTHLTVYDGWVYYLNQDDLNKIYKIRPDGSEKKAISKDSADQFCIMENSIFFIKADDINIRRIYKIGLDGSDLTKLNDLHSDFLNESDGWLYYTGKVDPFPGPHYIYKMRPDGTEIIILTENSATNLNVTNDWIYYSNLDSNHAIYRMNHNGDENSLVHDDYSSKINIAGDWLYYYNNQQRIYRVLKDGSRYETIVGDNFIPVKDSITVKKEKPESAIQNAINAARNGDVVVIEPGTYYGSIDFQGKAITLTSRNPEDPEIVAATIIDGGGSGSVITFKSGERNDSVLTGFTITGGHSDKTSFSAQNKGGAILIDTDSSPTIKNNIIRDNSAQYGGAIYISDSSSARVINNTIYNNWAEKGGALYIINSSPLIENNNIYDNIAAKDADTRWGYGGGLHISYSNPIVKGNHIKGNIAGENGGGIYIELNNTNFTIEGNNIENNRSRNGGGIDIDIWSNVTIRENLISENEALYYGGGILVVESTALIENNVISDNSSANGGAICFLQFDGIIKDNTIKRNKALESGGGIYLHYVNDILISGNILSENSATKNGGGLYLHADKAELVYNEFHANRAGEHGGAIWSIPDGNFYRYDPNSEQQDLVNAEINISLTNHYSYNEPDNLHWESIEDFD